MPDPNTPLNKAELRKLKQQYEANADYAGEHGFEHTDALNVLRLIAEVEESRKNIFRIYHMNCQKGLVTASIRNALELLMMDNPTKEYLDSIDVFDPFKDKTDA